MKVKLPAVSTPLIRVLVFTADHSYHLDFNGELPQEVDILVPGIDVEKAELYCIGVDKNGNETPLGGEHGGRYTLLHAPAEPIGPRGPCAIKGPPGPPGPPGPLDPLDTPAVKHLCSTTLIAFAAAMRPSSGLSEPIEGVECLYRCVGILLNEVQSSKWLRIVAFAEGSFLAKDVRDADQGQVYKMGVYAKVQEDRLVILLWSTRGIIPPADDGWRVMEPPQGFPGYPW